MNLTNENLVRKSINYDFLPMYRKDLKEKNLTSCDFIIITGDAYVDHPSFGAAIIGRLLEGRGYSVGIIAQPNWKTDSDFKRLGRPRLGFLITSGNLDSMVSHYSVNKKKRHEDVYSPGGKTGKRPDRAVIVYSQKVRELFSDIPIIIGGIEASLRRFAHYDYWEDLVRKPLLIDAQADLLVFGMGEKAIIEVAEALDSGISVKYLTYIKGTAYLTNELDSDQMQELPSYETVCQSKTAYAEATRIIAGANDAFDERIFIQPCGDLWLVQNPPQMPLTQLEFDDLYELPFTYRWHPVYDEMGGVPALAEVKFSITANRGCFGNCNFCAITIHQGKLIQMRSTDSIVREAKRMINDPDFKGYIHDIGGPTANFSHLGCERQKTRGVCRDRECLTPEPCQNLNASHQPYLEALKAVRKLPEVKKVFVRSGIRYDYLKLEKNKQFSKELVAHHVSGQLRVAPEHISEQALEMMGKPSFKIYEDFLRTFKKENDRAGKNQYVLPYFITGHPGTNLQDAIKLAEYIRDMGFMPEQIQDFYPTPGSLATAMYYTGLDPRTMEAVYVPKGREKAMQRALGQYKIRENYRLVKEALELSYREDLIGSGKKTLIPGDLNRPQNQKTQNKKRKSRKSHGKKTN
ncbi:YgiQ family radical SAM protein [Eubacteriaceae bacterium ES2]|nr:YgiQ family radical SAM protein [Eubacteriaceae bacterium ES2]